jgi:hypothetical protein
VPEIFVIAGICEKFGWTLEQFEDQPEDFIQAIILRQQILAEHEREEIKKMKRAK